MSNGTTFRMDVKLIESDKRKPSICEIKYINSIEVNFLYFSNLQFDTSLWVQ